MAIKKKEDEETGSITGLFEKRTGMKPEAVQGEAQAPGMTATDVITNMPAASVPDVIGEEQIRQAILTLNKYKAGKSNLERKIIENEKWYKVRHWEVLRKDVPEQVRPTSGWLFNSIANKHADAMDNFPSPNILPREEGDKAEAEKLSSIVPVILDQCDFEQVYSDVWNYKLMSGTGVYGVFWDATRLNGLGDVAIKKIDLLNLFWEPGVTDIQQSRNIFNVELMDDELIVEAYPQTEGKLGGRGIQVAEYQYDDSVDTTGKSVIVDWYYKKRNGNGKEVLHYCKFVNDVVLFATENEEGFRDTGIYEHAQYPFVFDVLFPMEGSPAGFGYIDIAKDTQAYIDRCGTAILENMLEGARPRYFFNTAGAVNEKEFTDLTRTIVHVDGQLGDDSIKPIQHTRLDGIYLSVLEQKIEEMKEVTGNRDVSNGGTSGGVTSASGVAAQQEAGARLSRDNSKAAYRAYRRIILLVIELIRQFYDLPRQFRIMGQNGAMSFTSYDNSGLREQPMGESFGLEQYMRKPLFDVEVSAQKASPYSKMSQNDLALSFYNAGFFNPEMADQALACLDMMDFDRKEMIMQKIEQNGTMYQMIQQMQQQMLMLGQMADRSVPGGGITEGLMQQFGMQPQMPSSSGEMNAAKTVENNEALGGDSSGESWVTKKARKEAAERSAVR